MAQPACSVVALSQDAGGRMVRLLDDCCAQIGVDGAWEVIVVTAGDAPLVHAYAARAGLPFRLHLVTGASGSAAIDRGIAQAAGAVIVRWDDGCRLPGEALAETLAALRQPGVAVVGGAQLWAASDASVGSRAIAAALGHALGDPAPGATEVPERCDHVAWTAYARSTWQRLAGHDPRLTDAASADAELASRARRSGLATWAVPKPRIGRSAPADLAALLRQRWSEGLAHARLLRCDPLAAPWRSLRFACWPPFLLVGGLLVAGGMAPAWSLLLAPGAALLAAMLIVLRTGVALRDLPAAVAMAYAALLVIHLAWGCGWWYGLVPVGPVSGAAPPGSPAPCSAPHRSGSADRR